jgi:hypothetical protein
MRLLTAIFTYFVFLTFSYAQTDSLNLKKRVIGTFHTTNTIYSGLSFGFASTMDNNSNVTTNGLRLEIPGIGIISFMGNGFPNA